MVLGVHVIVPKNVINSYLIDFKLKGVPLPLPSENGRHIISSRVF